MSVQAMSWVIQESKSTGNCFVVLLMIANHAKSDGSDAWPSIRTLARESRVSESTTHRAILKLVGSGELRIKVGEGPRNTNLYDIPGVRLTPGGVKLAREGCQIERKGVSPVTPEPSLTVHKDNQGNFYLLGPDGIRTIIGPGEARKYGYT